jgi:N-acylneuraminate cytidylyltransferase
VYVQNASLEIAWTRVAFETRSIAGQVIIPFFTEEYEGFDVNRPEDWDLAGNLCVTGQAALPNVSAAPYPL